MEIKPTYVSFEQAKRLKEKGFNIPCKTHCFIGNTGKIVFETSVHCIDWGNRPHIKTVQKYSVPEQWQVVEYLRVNHGIHITLTTYALGYQYHLNNTPDPKTWHIDKRYNCKDDFKTPQEAYSAAFDYILNELI